jgi:hypothetical protein
MVLLTPLFLVGIPGMEHSLHLLLTLLFVQRFDRCTESPWIIGTITVSMVATRDEGMFMAAVAADTSRAATMDQRGICGRLRMASGFQLCTLLDVSSRILIA